MPLKNATRLPGGRGYNTGANSYVNNAFQNEQRRQTLGGLAAVYITSDRTATSADTTGIVWSVTSLPGWVSPQLRGFTLQSDGATLFCQIPGTYRINASMRIVNVAASASFNFAVQVRRAGVVFQSSLAIFQNASSTGALQGVASILPFVIDLQAGDLVVMNPSGLTIGSTILGGTLSTGLVLEQLDVQR